VRIDDGRLTAVNSDLTTGTVSGTLNVASNDGILRVPFVIQLSATGAKFVSVRGLEFGSNINGETEDGTSNPVAGDLKVSTVSVTPKKNANGETTQFTFSVSLTLIQNP
jgi:hypothetical protein